MYPSPLKDDGYDIADFYGIHPTYGTRRGLPEVPGRRPRARPARHRRPRHEPHLRPAPVVPGGPRRTRASPYRDYYVWSDTDQRYRDARIIFTDTEKSNWSWDPVRQAVLLAPVLQPPARPQLRQPGREERDARRHALLARPRARRLPLRRRALPDRARGHQLREPARRRTSSCKRAAARHRPASTAATACCWPRPTSGRRTCAPTSATATSSTWRSTSRSCRACTWPSAARTACRSPTSSPTRRRSRPPASGASSCATTTS